MSTTGQKNKRSRHQRTRRKANRARSNSQRIDNLTCEAAAPEDWASWQQWLQERSLPRPLDQVLPSRKAHPALWGWSGRAGASDDPLLPPPLLAWAGRSGASNGRIAHQLELWLEASERPEPDRPWALQSLLWAYGLVRLAQWLPAAAWWSLLEQLRKTAEDARAMDDSGRLLEQQWLAVELPLVLASQFPELDDCAVLMTWASQQLSDAIDQWLDGEGLLHASLWPYAAELFACWTRSMAMVNEVDRQAVPDVTRAQYQWLVRQMFRLRRTDGSLVFSEPSSPPLPDALVDLALSLASDGTSYVLSDQLRAGPSRDAEKPRRRLPPLSLESEWAAAAVVRSDWSRRPIQLAVTYAHREIRCEFNHSGHTLWSGLWQPTVQVDGRLWEPASDWEQICWESDSDGDYLELEMTYREGGKVQRQMYLAREDQFLFVADAVLGTQPGHIEYASCLPLRRDVAFVPADETNEGDLMCGRLRMARVMPLALPEWRCETTSGQLEPLDDGLALRQQGRGQRLCAPWFFDLNRRRLRRQFTWRRLTVAERLEIQRPDVAVGYRVQAGSQQWLIYRSLAACGNRSLLGQNFSTEFVLARFTPEGETEKLIEIEP